MQLFKLDARTGALRGRLLELAADEGGNYGMVAASNRLWLVAGNPGANGFLLYFSTNPLRLLAASCVDVCMTRSRMPVFGESPDIGISAGRVWVASFNQLACFSPSKGRALAIVDQTATPPLVTNSLVDVAGTLWGNTDVPDDNPPSGLVRLTPPRACAS